MQLRPSRILTSERGFTLIELLVVISIIAILASLALPALNGALTAAKKAQANTMISQIKVAVTGFNTEYGTWPTSPTSDATALDQTALYHTLIGDTVGADSTHGNTRQIVFMEFATKDLDSATSPSMFVDPWYKASKNSKQNYQVLVDADFDGKLSTVPTGGTGASTINASVGVWDPGPPVTKGSVNAGTSTAILKSW